MRLIVLATPFPPAGGHGLARCMGKMSMALASAGHEVHVVAADYGDGCVSPFCGDVTVHGPRVPLPLKHYHWVGDTVLKSVILLERAVEVSEEHGPFDVLLADSWHAALAAKSLKTIHGLPLALFMDVTEPGRRGSKLTREQLYVAEMEAWACEHADVVVANGRFVAEELVRAHRVPLGKIAVVPCCLDPKRFESGGDLSDLRALFAEPSKSLVLYVGQLSSTGGVDLLIEAVPGILREGREVRFVVVGEGVLGDALKARARELEVADQMLFTGSLSAPVLGAAYRIADLVVVPSRYEPTGMHALEAMMCGAPVAISDTGAHEEIASQAAGMFRFASGDVEALSTVVCDALAVSVDEEQRSQLRADALRHSPPAVSQAWSELLSKMVPNWPAGTATKRRAPGPSSASSG